MKTPSILLCAIAVLSVQAADPAGTRRVTLLSYPDCIELSNGDTTVVLGHHVGGRVLKYSWRGKDALYLSDEEAKWTPNDPKARRVATAGRFDIGPEYLIPKRDVLWSGEWTAEITGPRAARLTSQPDAATGVQLVREFRLDANGSHLACTQTIRNVSQATTEWCHWSRTFALPGGIGVVPLSGGSKYPNGYVMYQQGKDNVIALRPSDPNIRQRDGFIEVLAPPAFPKLGFDSMAGWFGYQMPNGLAFVKRYATFPDRVYNEVAGLTISIWYPQPDKTPAVELEPIGPRERLKPGESASFTEHWWLLENEFPKAGAQLDLKALAAKVARVTAKP
jgi:hypothetical protein